VSGEADQGGEVPRGPVLSAERDADRVAAAAGAAGGRAGAGGLLRGPLRQARAEAADLAGGDGPSDSAPLARQRAAAGERDGAGVRDVPRRRDPAGEPAAGRAASLLAEEGGDAGGPVAAAAGAAVGADGELRGALFAAGVEADAGPRRPMRPH